MLIENQSLLQSSLVGIESVYTYILFLLLQPLQSDMTSLLDYIMTMQTFWK